MNEKDTVEFKSFFLYPKNFKSYKWFKPILVSLLTLVFYLIITNAISMVWGVIQVARGINTVEFMHGLKNGYDSFNAYSFSGALLSLGSIASIIPALAIAAKIVGERPFSSYISSKGGWRMKTFLICFGICLIVSAVPVFIIEYMDLESRGPVSFTTIGFILCTLLGPLQCIGEEFFFRSLLPQTIVSWFRYPIIGIIISTLAFMAVHPYNGIGKMEIVCTGAAMCVMAWIANGIEASSAIHITNNMTLFYMGGFGLKKMTSQAEIKSVISTAIIDLIYIAILLIIKKKTNLFDDVKKDDITPFNDKYEKKLEEKQAKKLS